MTLCLSRRPRRFSVVALGRAARPPCEHRSPARRRTRAEAEQRRRAATSDGPSSRQKPEETPKYEETVVVSRFKGRGEAGQRAGDDERHRARGDRERAVTRTSPSCCARFPALNITQISARDINVTTRGATGTLATGQLALLDGRSLYQDFFGFVMWDFLPVNFNEIKQIEVIRGPASAVWGANALNGVVNVITKSPREMQGTSAVVRRRRVRRGPNDEDAGALWYVERHPRAGGQRSRGPTSSRPAATRRIRCRVRPARFPATGRRSAPSRPRPIRRYTNTGHDAAQVRRAASTTTTRTARKLSFSGGVSGTDGIMHTRIGPFDIQSGTVMGYGKANYAEQRLCAPASSPTS